MISVPMLRCPAWEDTRVADHNNNNPDSGTLMDINNNNNNQDNNNNNLAGETTGDNSNE